MPELLIHNVSKRYGDVKALDNINLYIRDGEFCVIVGPSGSGKTTLLNIIAGFTKPDDGEVLVDGKPFNHLSPRERNIGMVFQDIGLFSHKSVRKNLSFGMEIKKKDKKIIEKRVKEIATRLKIEKLLEKKPGLLSGGEAQRVAIGRTLITEPSFFLFDEPLGNLDANLRMEMLTEIKRLHLSLKKTFIYVTHDQEQALSAATIIIIMKAGKVLQAGSPREIYKKPVSIEVAEFFGISPMNLIYGSVIPYENGSLFCGAGLKIKLKEYLGTETKEVTLGIRPEDIALKTQKVEDGFGIINTVELLGDKKQIYLNIEQERPIIAVTSPKLKLNIQERIKIKLKEEGILLFDRVDGRRVYP